MMKTKVTGIFRPAGTSYEIWEIIDEDGSYAAGAFSEEEFIAGYRSLFPDGRIFSIKKMVTKDVGNGWRETI